MKLLNSTELRQYLDISSTVFYKFKNAGMPYHQLPGGRAYFLIDEVEAWLREAGIHNDSIVSAHK